MNAELQYAKNIFFKDSSLDEQMIEKLLGRLRHPYVNQGDLYFQSTRDEAWYLEDSQVKSGSFSIDQGVGIRAISGDKTGFSYCDHFETPSLLRAVDAARSIATQTSLLSRVPILSEKPRQAYYEACDPISSLTSEEKIALLIAVDQEARRLDPRVIQVNASLSATHDTVMIVNLDGQWAADVRPLVSLQVQVIVEDASGRRESGRSGGGGRLGYHYFLEDECALSYAREAVREALVNLEATAAPAGSMPVILGPGWPGVLLHEAVGHGLEGDFNRKKLSAFSERLGQQVASKGVTVVDDGTLRYRRGSLSMDDEGTPSQCTLLIEDGILVNYMQDQLNATLMGMTSTGNGRRESYAHLPMPRMTNTYMQGGVYDPEEMIRSVSRGLYAVNFSGGQVDITSGQFVFTASEAYLIEQGKITRPVKGATIVGHGPEVMQQISMVGHDLALDKGIGNCGKDGQSVPVGVGQPTLKIDRLVVGGTGS